LRPRHVGRLIIASVVMVIAIALAATGERGAIVVAAIMAIATVTVVLLRSRRMIVVDGTGVTLHGVKRTHISWDHVACYTYWTSTGLDGARANKDPDKLYAAIKIVSADRDKVTIDSKWQRPYRAVEAAIEEIHPRIAGADFGVFTFEDGALHHRKRGRIAFADIDRVVVTADQLSVRQRGKTLEWAGTDFKHLANTLLFLEQLRAHAITVIVTGGQFLPPRVVERMRKPPAGVINNA